MSSLPPPVALGFPEHFGDWRKHQPTAILRAIESEQRFVALVLPTGAGKSLTVAGAATLAGWRTCILTSTKALQTQYLRDFRESGMVEVKGQNAYACVAFEDEHEQYKDGSRTQSCEEGPCHSGHRCSRKPSVSNVGARGCFYYDALAAARTAPLVVTNYKFWLTQNYFGTGIGKFDCLVLDEAHHAPQELADFLSTELTRRDISHVLQASMPSDPDDIEQWAAWAKRELAKLDRLFEQWKPISRSEMWNYRQAKSVSRKLAVMGTMRSTDWILTEHGDTFHFDPIWVHDHSGRLFLSTPHVILTSATFARKTAAMLGIEDEQMDWYEAPSDFPIARRPIIYLPTVKLTHKSEETDPQSVKLWVAKIDNIIRQRRDRKGIIHTVSYKRRNTILRLSEFTDSMISHDRETTKMAVDRFKQAGPGAILVSPSMSTGYDFPGEQCEYQIITKVPFPDSRSPIVQARTVVDPDYPAYIAMQEIVQAVGRGMRSAEDSCESFICDDNAKWFIPKYRQMAPQWFMQAYRKLETIPEPPRKL